MYDQEDTMAENKGERALAVEKQLAQMAKISDEELFERLGTDIEGLNQVEASDRLEEYGKNIIDAGNGNNLLKRVREALINPFNIVLLLVAAVTLVTDVMIADKPSWATFLMLIFVVAVSGVISFVQEERRFLLRSGLIFPFARHCRDSLIVFLRVKFMLMCFILSHSHLNLYFYSIITIIRNQYQICRQQRDFFIFFNRDPVQYLGKSMDEDRDRLDRLLDCWSLIPYV